MLGAAGFASSTFDLLRHEGWDAFLHAQEAQRRARRRLPWRRKEEGAEAEAAGTGGTPSKVAAAGAAAAAAAGAVEAGEAGGRLSEEEQEERQFLPAELAGAVGGLRRVLLRAATLDAVARRHRELLQAFSSRGPLVFGGALVDFPELAAKQQEAEEAEAQAAGEAAAVG